MLKTKRRITVCPSCESSLEVTELSCTACRMKLSGVFPPAPLARIAPEHQQFIETFVLCRGIIRDVERTLGISYPTVRARLDAAVIALEEAVRPPEAPVQERHRVRGSDSTRRDILQQVASGDLTPAEAAERLRILS